VTASIGLLFSAKFISTSLDIDFSSFPPYPTSASECECECECECEEHPPPLSDVDNDRRLYSQQPCAHRYDLPRPNLRILGVQRQ